MTGIQRDRGREEKRGEKGKEKWRGETDGTICTQQIPNRRNKFYVRGGAQWGEDTEEQWESYKMREIVRNKSKTKPPRVCRKSRGRKEQSEASHLKYQACRETGGGGADGERQKREMSAETIAAVQHAMNQSHEFPLFAGFYLH